ncbi:alpha-N-arabinofuranosidase [Bythopirellula polymerisocia]|uniref:non-reducing end alpha-L-arabinofuranosidase n=1 Tax=Bythopirellula polymerisocia TaxID=2528003 RepID=A0A5C6D3P8_9BACT|nr:alpha-N-arabinofuranosidase [Bythopirellula polymerisocia]TWU30401.1 Intracellular exo-alpha-L-arabinofuranosidase 2 [Bythopirellula polymerisocia]
MPGKPNYLIRSDAIHFILALILFPQIVVAAQAATLSATATIQGDQEQGTISKHIYGHFMEHLGRCIYDGLWVGEDSSIPNTRGIRNDVIAALKELNCPNLRWPGGCFADDYHWRDGIGPRKERPKRINIHWGQVIETNAFGTHEFLDLCEIVGAEPYVAGNVGSGSPQEMRDWIEYMTFDGDSELANLRRANGREKPWKIPFFGVGNENWGCGGNMTPEFYADLYKRFATFCRDLSGNHLMRVACGPNGGNDHWTSVVFPRVSGQAEALSLHYYTLSAPWHDKLRATGFSEVQWFGILNSTLRMGDILDSTEAIMNATDPEKYRHLFVDEWGTWYREEEGTNPSVLFQQNSLRDALVAGLNFHIFQQHHERVKLCNIAQTVNVLQAMILTEGPKMLLTPTYHAFEMCKVHQDTKYLPVKLESPRYSLGSESIPAVSVSASRATDGTVYISLVNTHALESVDLKCQLADIDASQVAGRVLTADALDAHNTFDQPNRVEPSEFSDCSISATTLNTTLPPHSLVVLTLSK